MCKLPVFVDLVPTVKSNWPGELVSRWALRERVFLASPHQLADIRSFVRVESQGAPCCGGCFASQIDSSSVANGNRCQQDGIR